MSPLEYDRRLNCPPTFAHRIHEELVAHEEERVRAEEAAGRALAAPAPEVARQRVAERHGRPGPGLTVRREHLEERCSADVCTRIAVRDGEPLVLGGGSTIRAECPVCPRHEQAWALVYLGNVGEPVRSTLQAADLSPASPPGKLPPYACSGCWTRWIAEGRFLKSEWVAAHGAPPELVRKHQVEERIRELEQEHDARNRALAPGDREPFYPDDARAQAEREIPPAGGAP